MPKVAAAADSPDTSKWSVILDAAESCILEFGANKVSINDIAKRAKIGRMTVYRTFENRQAILSALVMRRMEAIATNVAAALEAASAFEQAVIDGSILTVRLADADEIWQSISKDEGAMQFDQLLLSRGSLGGLLFARTWQRTIELGRKEGLIRDALSNEQVGEWIRNMHFLLIHRADLDDDQKARFLARFALPALRGSTDRP